MLPYLLWMRRPWGSNVWGDRGMDHLYLNVNLTMVEQRQDWVLSQEGHHQSTPGAGTAAALSSISFKRARSFSPLSLLLSFRLCDLGIPSLVWKYFRPLPELGDMEIKLGTTSWKQCLSFQNKTGTAKPSSNDQVILGKGYLLS